MSIPSNRIGLLALWPTALLLAAVATPASCGHVDCDCMTPEELFGQLTDSQTGEPISEATFTVTAGQAACFVKDVRELGGQPGYTCDVKPGPVVIQVSAPGYDSKTVSTVVPVRPEDDDVECRCQDAMPTRVDIELDCSQPPCGGGGGTGGAAGAGGAGGAA